MKYFLKNNKLLVSGIAFLLLSVILYLGYGYHHVIAGLWLFSLVLVAVYFFNNDSQRRSRTLFTRQDFVIALLLTGVAAIAYFSVGSDYPKAFLIDEIDTAIQSLLFSRSGFDLFQPSKFFFLPAPVFAAAGYVSELLFGFVDIVSTRLVHTALTVASIFLSYFLFRRVFSEKILAASATVVLAGSHSLFAVGHLNLLTNSAMLVQVAALLFLLIGLRERSLFYTFVGGAIAGLGWVVYSPAKIVILTWLVSLIAIALLQKINFSPKRIILVTLVGFLMAICPFVVSGLNTPRTGIARPGSYMTRQILFFPGGREVQKEITGSESEWSGIKLNIVNGLTAFNSKGKRFDGSPFAVAHWDMYVKFVDSLTGVLLWVGVFFMFLTLRRREPEEVVLLLHFLLLFLTFSFFVTGAPNIPRLIITLPFVAFLSVFGVYSAVSGMASRLPKIRKFRYKALMGKLCVGVVVAVILLLNIQIGSGYITKRSHGGEDPMFDATHFIYRQMRQVPQTLFSTDKKSGPYTASWGADDWQRAWFNLLAISRQPFVMRDMSVAEYLQYRRDRYGGEGTFGFEYQRYAGMQREPVSNTLYHIVAKAHEGPHYFYLVNRRGYHGEHPREFASVYDWEVWRNLFTIFRQSFEIVTADMLLADDFHRLPATLFITPDDWRYLSDRLSSEYRVVEHRHLSSRRGLLIVVLEKGR